MSVYLLLRLTPPGAQTVPFTKYINTFPSPATIPHQGAPAPFYLGR